jgi:hypothetical protein
MHRNALSIPNPTLATHFRASYVAHFVPLDAGICIESLIPDRLVNKVFRFL